jgi:hypothetical protein
MESNTQVWSGIKAMFRLQTGIGKHGEDTSTDIEAVAAIFLPLTGLTIGICAAAAARLVQMLGFYLPSFVVALAVLLSLGGLRRLEGAVKPLIRHDNSFVPAVVTALMVILFQLFAIYELNYSIGSIRSQNSLFFNAALLYLPVISSFGTVASAAIGGKEEEAVRGVLSGVKAWHLLSCALLTFLLMLPRFGLMSLFFIVATVFFSAMTSMLCKGRTAQYSTPQIAALASEMMFLVLLIMLYKMPVYY